MLKQIILIIISTFFYSYGWQQLYPENLQFPFVYDLSPIMMNSNSDVPSGEMASGGVFTIPENEFWNITHVSFVVVADPDIPFYFYWLLCRAPTLGNINDQEFNFYQFDYDYVHKEIFTYAPIVTYKFTFAVKHPHIWTNDTLMNYILLPFAGDNNKTFYIVSDLGVKVQTWSFCQPLDWESMNCTNLNGSGKIFNGKYILTDGNFTSAITSQPLIQVLGEKINASLSISPSKLPIPISPSISPSPEVNNGSKEMSAIMGLIGLLGYYVFLLSDFYT